MSAARRFPSPSITSAYFVGWGRVVPDDRPYGLVVSGDEPYSLTIAVRFVKALSLAMFSAHTVQITFIFIGFSVCNFAFAFKTFRVLNAFYFQTVFNLRFRRKRDVRLTCKHV